jgi:aspartate/methionine/tyrosine aminotransferase
VHDFLSDTVPTPLQTAAVVALSIEQNYYTFIKNEYERKRKILSAYLEQTKLLFNTPEGAYYFFQNCSLYKFRDSIQFANSLLEKGNLAVVPYNAFYKNEKQGAFYFRINFAKDDYVLHRAGECLVKFCNSL